MATKEGSTYTNPIRFWNSSTNSSNYAKANKVFEEQRPGRFVDFMANVYFCTTYKTVRGEPIWQRIDNSTKKPVGKYILISTGDSGKKPVSRTSSGAKISYTLQAVNLRANLGQIYNKTSFGTFIFIALSAGDEISPASPTGSTSSFTGTINSAIGPSEYATSDSIVNSFKYMNEAYEYMKRDSNGRSGFGASSAPIRYSPAALERMLNRTDANGRSGFGASAETPPGSGGNGSSNPSSGSGRGRGTGAGGIVAPPLGTPNSPGLPTVIVTVLPDKNIYNGRDSYSGYADKPHIQQIITDYDPIKKQRQRIIRRHIFDIIPNSFEFSQLSSTWNEVERSGNYPMVDWSKYNLTKCSFRFLVAGRRLDTIDRQSTLVNDGMDVSVDAEIENIRAIAGAPYPVLFNNLNKLISTSYRFPYLENTRGIQWVIADLSITATRLTPNGRGIAAAEVSITLNEYPVIARDIVPLPPLTPDRPVPRQCKPRPCTPPRPSVDPLLTDGYFFKPDNTLAYGEAQQ